MWTSPLTGFPFAMFRRVLIPAERLSKSLLPSVCPPFYLQEWKNLSAIQRILIKYFVHGWSLMRILTFGANPRRRLLKVLRVVGKHCSCCLQDECLAQFWLASDCNNGKSTWSVSARRSHWVGNLQTSLITITIVTLVKGKRLKVTAWSTRQNCYAVRSFLF